MAEIRREDYEGHRGSSLRLCGHFPTQIFFADPKCRPGQQMTATNPRGEFFFLGSLLTVVNLSDRVQGVCNEVMAYSCPALRLSLRLPYAGTHALARTHNHGHVSPPTCSRSSQLCALTHEVSDRSAGWPWVAKCLQQQDNPTLTARGKLS